MRSRVVLDGPVDGTYAALAALLPADLATEPAPGLVPALADLCAFVDTRRDCADFRVVALLAVLLAGKVPDECADQVRRSLAGFKYWMAEPGDDAMCLWSENHQLLFAAGEYLAGAALAEETFTNDRRTGQAHCADGRARLERWFDLRFRWGFSEWLSPVYYEEDAAALSLLVDHAPDPDIARRAAATLDLLLLDCAVHRFDGHLAASSGRVYADQKKHPASAEVQPVLDHAFTDADVVADWNRIGTVFLLRQRYEVPAAIHAVAADTTARTVSTGHGVDIAEVVRDLPDPDAVVSQLWAMEAFVNPGAIRSTMAAFRAWGMRTNPFLSALMALEWLPPAMLPLAMRVANPVVAGTVLERAHVTTTRSASYALSCAVGYRPRHFGDQQHLWQVLLAGGVPLFTTHPGGPLVDDATRQRTPSAWVGNGVNPTVAAAGPVLLAVYDTRGRRGYGEARRVRASHLYVPYADLDETAGGSHWLAVRQGEGLVGVLATSPLVAESTTSVRQEGAVTGWVVICAELADHGTLDAFCAWLARCTVERVGARLHANTPLGSYRLARGRLHADGARVVADHGRYDTPWVSAPFNPDRIEVTAGGSSLVLGKDGSREVS